MERVPDCTRHHAGFYFRCDWPTNCIIGEIVTGRYFFRQYVEICWSGITDCEPGDWDRFVDGLVDDEGEHWEFVLDERGIVFVGHRHPVYHVEGKQVLRTEQKEDWSSAYEPSRQNSYISPSPVVAVGSRVGSYENAGFVGLESKFVVRQLPDGGAKNLPTRSSIHRPLC